MRKGFIFTGTIRAMNSEGAGITHLPDDGRVVFVPGACIGETVKVKLLQVKSKYAQAQIVELDKTSPQRVTPSCVHHGFQSGKCGACPWMYLSYDEQLRLKQQRVCDVVARLNCNDFSVKPIRASARIEGYRNRAQFKTDGKALGYVSFASDQLAPIESCKILTESNQEQLSHLLAQLPHKEWQPKNRRVLTTIDIDDHTGSLSPSVDKRLPFRQANSEQNSFMREWLRERLQCLDTSWPLLELFCGAGNFTEVVAGLGFSQVMAVDAVASELSHLRGKKLPSVRVMRSDLFDDQAVRSLLKQVLASKILLLDPPRDGFKTRLEFIKSLKKLQDIIYVSCDLATWSRDAKDLLSAGFRLKEVQALDLFPQTPHVEVLSVFSKSKK